jgi:mono/diheme cytochrome c family protein
MAPIFKRVFKIAAWIVGVLVVLIFALVLYITASWNTPHNRALSTRTASRDSVTIARGEFIFKVGNGCWQCHSTVLNANASPSGGRLFDLSNIGPGFGKFYAPNITPDEETGIGKWTDAQIVRALREGLRHDGTPLFPIMPMATLKGLSDDDAFAVVSYLRSIPPVRNPVPPREIWFPTKALFALGVVGPEPPITQPIVAAPKGLTPEYGQYLARHAALCSDCHTVRDLNTGAFYFDSLMAGSSIEFGRIEGDAVWTFAPNITPDPETGIGNWSEADFLLALRTGTRPDGKVLSNHMPYALYGLWEEDDLRAVYMYLKTIKPIRRSTPPPIWSERITKTSGSERGKAIFSGYCILCHGEAGSGAMSTKLVLADLAQTIDDATLKKFILDGQVNLRMPGFRRTLTDDDVNDVVAYIRTLKK